jgi:predicted DsbA family dithiol-disulfide isomerase
MLEIVEYTDPACPWAWGSEPTFIWLRKALAGHLSWRRVFGILFDDDDDQPPDREAETRYYERWLAGVSTHTRAPYPERLNWVAATSWPASLVAKAAQSQGVLVAERVLRRLRETTFVEGTPADTIEAALAAVDTVADLDPARLRADALSATVLRSLRVDYAETRTPSAAVDAATLGGPHPGRRKEIASGLRYALPTIVMRGPAGEQFVPGWRSRADYVAAMHAVAPDIELQAVSERPQDLLEELGSVTRVDLELLTAGGAAPSAATHIPTRNGGLWRGI